ncbi:flavin reductase family protein [Dietzia maris]|uniref:flavin reductase family protein n=1 Tax=Dietzia maris TaxID=37915 RepID=UPI0037C7E766
MIVVTTVAEDALAGCLVGFHAQAGISAERYCLWLSKANHTYRTGLRATHFAVHFLTQDDLSVAERFGTQSGETTDKFVGLDLDTSEHGVPLIARCPNRMVLERIAVLDDGGDHACFTTRVLSARAGEPFTPLRLSDVTHLEPGRSSESRAVHP